MTNNINELMKTRTCNMHFRKVLIWLLILCKSISVFSINNNIKRSPGVDNPLRVSISLHINNICNFNTVDETYQVDGYLVYKWHDERMKFTPDSCLNEPQIYINDMAKELITTKLWFPTCEYINDRGNENCTNIRIEISPDGDILYTERFLKTFSSNMNFKRFPFDSQYFKIVIEPWGHNNKEVILVNPKLFPKLEESVHLMDKWQIDSMYTYTCEKIYDHLGSAKENNRTWSRVIFEVKAKRLSGYFMWQILFPLFIIIMASFVIFWISDFSIQIGIGFSLMLTVVAFNFYSASILPKLPYNTFIEYVILVGYIFIFMGIIAVIINYRINGNDEKEVKYPLLNFFRYLFPLVYLIIMGLLSIIHLVDH